MVKINTISNTNKALEMIIYDCQMSNRIFLNTLPAFSGPQLMLR